MSSYLNLNPTVISYSFHSSLLLFWLLLAKYCFCCHLMGFSSFSNLSLHLCVWLLSFSFPLFLIYPSNSSFCHCHLVACKCCFLWWSSEDWQKCSLAASECCQFHQGQLWKFSVLQNIPGILIHYWTWLTRFLEAKCLGLKSIFYEFTRFRN